ncbi:MAG: phage tail protein [candidate division Zixibacteria bacterium]|nr:phage tail protein [candidate division Zixibacteria bacterium]
MSRMRGDREEERDTRFYGVVVGVVTNIDDPQAVGRVRVSFPWLSDEDESHWARVTQVMAGSDRGAWIIPEVGDEVLCAFEHGDIRHPYVIGSLYNGQDGPPSENGHSSENNLRMFKSKSGHILKFDDTSGSEEIKIIAKDERSTVTIKADGNIEIECDNAKITATQDLDLEGMNVNIKANSQLKFEGATGVEIKSSAMGKVEASGILELKGSLVNIN